TNADTGVKFVNARDNILSGNILQDIRLKEYSLDENSSAKIDNNIVGSSNTTTSSSGGEVR
ncbi:MAG TPA: hypothetical protein VE692_07195, partial [Nitrososphaera sp.]|nr:hypothetical protein [Nitrososphaera sp.]